MNNENYRRILNENDLPELIGPLKPNNINFPQLSNKLFDSDNDLFKNTGDFFVDYDGFISLLTLCDFNIKKYLHLEQQDQLSGLVWYLIGEKKFDQVILLIKARADWLINEYSEIEEYELADKALKNKNKFITLIDDFNGKFKSNYGKLPLEQ